MIRFLIIVLAAFPVLSFAQCKSLRKKTSKVDGEITIRTPFDEAAIAHKVTGTSATHYYLTLTAPASPSGEREGVTILLDNGQKLEFPNEKVSVKVESYHPRWSNTNLVARSYVEISPEQMQLLAAHRIATYKLHVYEWELRERLGKDLQQNIGCLLTVNPDNVKE